MLPNTYLYIFRLGFPLTEQLRSKVNTSKWKEKQEYFGSSTPSSKKPFKENSLDENKKKNGGGKKEHKGHGRYSRIFKL